MPTLAPVFHLPFELPPNSSVLVAGCGGGYDIVCALPVALALRQLGHTVHLANYSFTELQTTSGCSNPLSGLYRVDRHARPNPHRSYFPELLLARWWYSEFQDERPVWAFNRTGMQSTIAAYRYLQESLGLQVVIVVDGGVDGLFIGNEHDLGTPSMDAISILSAAELQGCLGIFAFTAFGTEGTAYSVRHADALLRIADLTRLRQFLGVAAAAPGSTVAEQFLRAVRSIHGSTEDIWHSNMVSSVEAAMRGSFGETAVTVKTQTDRIWVSALTLLYWFFNLEAVAAAKPYRNEVLATDSVGDVYAAIERTRERLGVLERAHIPI